MDDHIKYKPTSQEYDNLGNEYWEVWQGIPEEILKDSFPVGGGNYKYNKNYKLIYISSKALEALKKNPKAILCVKLEKSKDHDKKVLGFLPSEESLEDTIRNIQRANQRFMKK
ncbi:hypothetical protein HY837_05470 [archaeon]|nr:hypothetical protein [archaeon]